MSDPQPDDAAEGALPADHDPYEALRTPSFGIFLIGNFLFVVAYQMQTVAVGWELYQRTGKPLALGLVGLVEFAPVLLFGLIAGQVADRVDRRKLVMVCVALVGAASLLMAWASAWHAPLWTLYAALLAIGVGRAFQQPAKASLLPQIVPLAHFSNAVTWATGTFHLASVIGPACGGFMVFLLGDPWLVYALDGLLALGFCVMLIFVKHRGHTPERGAANWQSFLAGLEFIRRRPVILGAITLDMFAVLLGGAVALLPVYADDILSVGPQGLGWLRAAPAIGALGMAFLLAHRPPLAQAGRALLASVAGFGIATIVFGFSQSFALSFAMLFLTGALDNVSVVIRQTLVQILTPDEMRGRVAAVNSMFIGASNELGGFESGLVAQFCGPVFAVVSGGVGTLLVVAAVALFWPELARYGRLGARHAS